jgi:hypothetical protein
VSGTLPPLDRVCAVCRRGLYEGEACPSGEGAKLLRLDDPTERFQLLGLAWAVVPKIRWVGTNWRLIYAGIGAVVGALIGGPLAYSPAAPALPLFGAAAGAFVGLLVFATLAQLIPMPASFYHRRSVGADRGCGRRPRRALRGVLTAVEATSGPLVEGFELVVAGDQVTLRHGRTEKLLVELEDGRRLHVPAGPAELLGGAPHTYEALDAEAAEAIARAYGGTPDEAFQEEDEGPIPAEGGRRWALHAGARVAVFTETRLAPGASRGGAFRSAANRDLAPTGLPRFHVLDLGPARTG